MKLLRTTGPWHPGGYPYIDPRTGKRYDGMSADFGARALEIQKDRKINPDTYPPEENGGRWLDLDFIKGQLSNYICGQLHKKGLASRFCTDDNGALMGTKPLKTAIKQAAPEPVGGRKCRKCGSESLSANYCPTCSGKKIRSYTCNQCNAINNK